MLTFSINDIMFVILFYTITKYLPGNLSKNELKIEIVLKFLTMNFEKSNTELIVK